MIAHTHIVEFINIIFVYISSSVALTSDSDKTDKRMIYAKE